MPPAKPTASIQYEKGKPNLAIILSTLLLLIRDFKRATSLKLCLATIIFKILEKES